MSPVPCNLNVRDVKCFAIRATLVCTIFFFSGSIKSVITGPESTILETDQASEMLVPDTAVTWLIPRGCFNLLKPSGTFT
jgi:hypothetical protein